MESSSSYFTLNLEYLFYQIYQFLTGGDAGELIELVKDLWLGIVIASAIASVVLFVLLLWVIKKSGALMAAEKARYEAAAAAYTRGGASSNERWQDIIELVNSENPGNWRLAIIEADIMLDDLLKRMGLLGDTIGERLKMLGRDSFRTLDQAWEAHKVRNQIAHEGSDFVLSQREARRVIEMFRQVFQDNNML